MRRPTRSSRILLAPLVFMCSSLVGVAAAAGVARQLPTDPGEFGDAPEGAPAYPALGVAGQFPTCLGGPAGYVYHANRVPLAWFGLGLDVEPDGNAGFCAPPPYEMDECWGAADGDGGLVNASTFTIFQGNIQQCSGGPYASPGMPCAVVQWGGTIDMMVSNLSGNVAMINVLFDWNQDGRWNGQVLCPGGGPVPEHAIWNLPVPDGYIGLLSGLSPGPLLIGPNYGPVWARFTIGDPIPMQADWDGSWDFDTGETEDYLLSIGPEGGPLGAGELGDAPEDVPAYPGGIIGRFPTCIATGPAGFIFHAPPLGGFFGPMVDLEQDGNHDLCGFVVYDNDECDHSGGDAGLLYPQAYDLTSGNPVACSPVGAVVALPGPCRRVVWGADIDIRIDNSAGPDLYFNVLADWDRSADWGQTVTCANGDTGSEHVVANHVVPGGFAGPASLLGLPSFQALSSWGFVWFRFSLTDVAVPADWTGEGVFGDGETEDYLLHVGQPSAVPPSAEGRLGLRLLPCQPNPFNPRTVVGFELDRPAEVSVTIHDARGRLVRTLFAGWREAGGHELVWTGDDDAGRRLESGAYVVRALSAGAVRTQKIVLLK